MITHLQGRMLEKTPSHVVLDVAGVGYLVHISLQTYSAFKDEEAQFLYTHFVVREDAQLLYGFKTKSERSLFEKLIAISGIGANTARLILSALSVEDFITVIATGDLLRLKSVKGIGEKTAERILIELKGKVNTMLGDASLPQGTDKNTLRTSSVPEQALLALIALGFAPAKAEKALQKTLQDNPNQPVELLIKKAMQNI
jgi:Holliday junction DNA helicase RuvA